MRYNAIAMLMSVTSVLYATAQDTLRVPTLGSEEMHAMGTNGQLGGFWHEWASSGRDSLVLTPPSDCYPGWCAYDSTTDARIVIKLAAWFSGLGVCIEVKDDEWVQAASDDDHISDIVSMWFDTLNPSELIDCDSCIIGDTGTGLSVTSRQLTFQLGNLPHQAKHCLYAFDTSSAAWESKCTLTTLRPDISLDVESIPLDSNTRALEAFVSWEAIGVPHLTDLGQHPLAFTVGYADRDGAPDDTLVLRWNGSDPLAPHDGVLSWGTLVFPDGVKTCSLRSIVPGRGSRSPVSAPYTCGTSIGIHFDCRGRVIAGSGADAAGVRMIVAPGGMAVPTMKLVR